jgi:micrococcal nuclease
MNTKRQKHLAPLQIIALFVTLLSPAIGFVVHGQRQQLLQVRVVLSIPQQTDRHINHHDPRWRRTGVAAARNKSIGDTLVNSALPVVLTTINTLRKELVSLSTIQKSLVVTALVLGFGAGRTTPFWKRYTDVAEIPATFFEQKRTLRGHAVRVSDGDTIRFLHRPMVWNPRQLDKTEKASELALPVRFCTVDTPETAKFGETGQPFASEAKEYVTKLLSNRPVYVQLLKRDQYSRIVAQVYIRKWRFFKTYLDEELLKQGLAEVYTGAGAVYGPKGKEAYEQLEQAARSKKIGLWSQGRKRESAADYKTRTKQL